MSDESNDQHESRPAMKGNSRESRRNRQDVGHLEHFELGLNPEAIRARSPSCPKEKAARAARVALYAERAARGEPLT